MNYQETLHWLYNQLPMFQRVGAGAYKADLSNTLLLAAHLGNPHLQFKCIHVAGTNGKGSTSHMLASVLQEAGYKVGLYTSPHLKDFRERIKINGTVIPKKEVISFVKENQTFFEQYSLSFFEMTVGLAFFYFAKAKVDIAVIEVGMGGRLDSTNIITPEVSVITNIGFDHTQYLGNTLAEIAAEKAGIIKPGVLVVVGETQVETKPVFEETALERKSKIVFADSLSRKIYVGDLKGNYQQKNRQTVVVALAELIQKGWKISEKNIQDGLKNTVTNTGLQGRWQQLRNYPKVIADTGHNEAGLRYVVQQLEEENYENLHMVIGVVADKDLEKVLPLLPKAAKYYFARPDIPRGLDSAVLKEKALQYGLLGKHYRSVKGAYRGALRAAGAKDLVFVGGSTFVVAEII